MAVIAKCIMPPPSMLVWCSSARKSGPNRNRCVLRAAGFTSLHTLPPLYSAGVVRLQNKRDAVVGEAAAWMKELVAMQAAVDAQVEAATATFKRSEVKTEEVNALFEDALGKYEEALDLREEVTAACRREAAALDEAAAARQQAAAVQDQAAAAQDEATAKWAEAQAKHNEAAATREQAQAVLNSVKAIQEKHAALQEKVAAALATSEDIQQQITTANALLAAQLAP